MMIKLGGGHNFFHILLIYFTLIFSKNLFAVQIYDYQTEKFINKINSEILAVNLYNKKIDNSSTIFLNQVQSDRL